MGPHRYLLTGTEQLSPECLTAFRRNPETLRLNQWVLLVPRPAQSAIPIILWKLYALRYGLTVQQRLLCT